MISLSTNRKYSITRDHKTLHVKVSEFELYVRRIRRVILIRSLEVRRSVTWCIHQAIKTESA